MDLFGNRNVLKRKDATCKLIYTPVGRLGARYIFTDPLYAATEDCPDEFYQGCFEDYSNEDFQVFEANIMPLLERAVGADLYSNKYFGDVTRISDVNGTWSWNKFDGIFKQIKRYITLGTIPSTQSFAITTAGSAITPTEANAVLDTAFAKQDYLMFALDTDEKAFYVDQQIYNAYYQFLVASGQTTIAERQGAGVPPIRKNGIEVKAKKWDGILASLNSGIPAHACILTVRRNFLYATDRGYGGGPRRDEAVRVWWSDDDNVWKRQIHLKAGTEIAAPQFIVLGMTNIS
jgi:hypothetical protein